MLPNSPAEARVSYNPGETSECPLSPEVSGHSPMMCETPSMHTSIGKNLKTGQTETEMRTKT